MAEERERNKSIAQKDSPGKSPRKSMIVNTPKVKKNMVRGASIYVKNPKQTEESTPKK